MSFELGSSIIFGVDFDVPGNGRKPIPFKPFKEDPVPPPPPPTEEFTRPAPLKKFLPAMGDEILFGNVGNPEPSIIVLCCKPAKVVPSPDRKGAIDLDEVTPLGNIADGFNPPNFDARSHLGGFDPGFEFDFDPDPSERDVSEPPRGARGGVLLLGDGPFGPPGGV